MGLKSFIVSSVTSKVIEKVSESGKIEEIANKTINKITEITGMETSSNYQPKRNNYLLIKTRSLSISSLAKLSKGVLPDVGESWGKHQVFDKYGNLKYSTELNPDKYAVSLTVKSVFFKRLHAYFSLIILKYSLKDIPIIFLKSVPK